MSESLEYREKKSRNDFYGAIKSENELYFKMASLYKEAAKGENILTGLWMERISKLGPGKYSW